MTDTKVSIIISGRALCRQKNGAVEGLLWQVDARHKLKLRMVKKIGNDSLATEYNVPEQTKIIFKTANLTPLPAPDPAINPDTDFSHIMDINALHGPAGTYVELKSIPNPGPADPKTSYFKLPGAICFTNKLSKYEFETWKHTKRTGGLPGTKQFVNRKKIGEEIRADFYVRVGQQLTITLEFQDGSRSLVLPFPHEDGVDYEIRMDNVCIDKYDVDDFFLYYEIIDGSAVEIEQVGPRNRFKDNMLGLPCNAVIGGDPNCDFELYALTGSCN